MHDLSFPLVLKDGVLDFLISVPSYGIQGEEEGEAQKHQKKKKKSKILYYKAYIAYLSQSATTSSQFLI